MLELYGDRYWFDTEGNVYSRLKKVNGEPIKLKSTIDLSGYERYTLRDINRKQHTIFKHRLVLITNMVEPKEGQTEVNHKDKNILNNSLENLEWCTGDENRKHKFSTLRKPSKLRKLTNEDVKLLRDLYIPNERGFGQTSLAKKFGIAQSTVRDILNGKAYADVK